jgi:lysozyme
MADLKRAAAKTLAGVLGSIAAAVTLMTAVPAEESGRKVAVTVAPSGEATVRHVSGPQYLRAYLDAVKVPTACDGITRGVRMGQTYTEARCAQLLETELIEHAEGVIACVPALYGRADQAAAAVSLAYNVGVAGFCKSTAARLFRAGQWRPGCDAFAMWNKAGGRVLAGLVARRARERALCLVGL